MLPALPPGTCKSSRGHPRRLRAAGRSSAPGIPDPGIQKNTGPDYVYIQDIPLGGMNFDGTALTGTVQLPAGDYKFLPSYGLVTPGNYTWPDFTDATLSDALYVTHTGENFPAAFMLNTPLDAVPSYTISLDGPQQTVSATPAVPFRAWTCSSSAQRRMPQRASIPKSRALTFSAPRNWPG